MVNLKEYDCLYKPFKTCSHLLHLLQPKFSFFFHVHFALEVCICYMYNTTLTVNCNCSCTAPALVHVSSVVSFCINTPKRAPLSVSVPIPLSVSEFSTYLHLHPFLYQ